MQRNWIVPTLMIGTVAGLLAVAGYPYLGGAQNARPEIRQVEIQPTSLPKLPPPPPREFELPAASIEIAPPVSLRTPAAPNDVAPLVLPKAHVKPGQVVLAHAQEPETPPAEAPKKEEAKKVRPKHKVLKAVVNKTSPSGAELYHDAAGKYYFNNFTVQIVATLSDAGTNETIVVYRDDSNYSEPAGSLSFGGSNKTEATFTVDKLRLGENRLRFAVKKDEPGERSATTHIRIQKTLPRATGVAPQNLAFNPGATTVFIQFDPTSPLADKTADDKITLKNAALPPGTAGSTIPVLNFNPATNAAEVKIGTLSPGSYEIAVAANLEDIYGNKSVDPTTFNIVVPVGADLPLTAPGITARTGPNVEMPEFLAPRIKPQGFNAGDHVETRVVRLYYFRDAHRVAQILNRDVQSYNRVAVDTRRRLAEQARTDAVNQSLTRKVNERSAVQTATETRVKERQVKAAEEQLKNADQRRNQGDKELPLAQKAKDDTAKAAPTATQLSDAKKVIDDAAKNLAVQRQAQADVFAPTYLAEDKQKASAKVEQGKKDLTFAQEILKKATTDDEKAKATEAVKQNEKLLAEATKAQTDLLVKVEDDKAQATDRVIQSQGTLDIARQTQADLVRRDQDRINADENFTRVKSALDLANSDINTARDRVIAARADLQSAQTMEVQKREAWQSSLDKEDVMKADQFRLEVAAMHEDPDTYVPGKMDSPDPVRQVSISVLGESEIHLRGPISGINIIREMINQIDSPTGQVRVAIHTIQINGERQEKMECVAGNIQDYIDHSRFLTQQSALLLRKAVFKIASRKAHIAAQLRDPRDTQAARDQRYLYEFFGKDFIEDLRVQNSEFLNTSNKLLSLNSMDTTSLASALFVIALAKNDTRQEIIDDFKHMLATELPMMEQSFFEAGGPRGQRCGKLTAHNFGCFPKKQCFELMAHNARFQSLLGFFDASVEGSDTLTPLQREFIKLAQILKSRLVTELEFKQRVTERSLVEERGGSDYLADLKKAAEDEREAKKVFAESITELRMQQQRVLQMLTEIQAVFDLIQVDAQDIVDDFEGNKTPLFLPRELWRSIRNNVEYKGKEDIEVELTSRNEKSIVKAKQSKVDGVMKITFDKDAAKVAKPWAAELVGKFAYVQNYLQKFDFKDLPEEKVRLERAQRALAKLVAELPKGDEAFSLSIENLRNIPWYQKASVADVKAVAGYYQNKVNELREAMQGDRPRTRKAYSLFVNLKDAKLYVKDPDSLKEIAKIGTNMHTSFNALFKAETDTRIAAENLERSRRPLDHKKLLDGLIDEIHEKYVELLDGTRSYTANIDDYIKRLATALDDDFNTQFYYPAFRKVRTMATSWDVQLGAVETTSILTNNRTFGKVDPQATMEFDLPKRSIFITEAFQSAKGLLDTYGALMQDPTFLNLARIGTGMPTSTPSLGSNAGVPSIRSVLPGMSRQTDEGVMAQSGSGGKSFGTPLDALIPDPAIYKFETGTAYEIRPVITPDGQSVNFHFNYMYTTNIREPVRADEKHLGRVKRHFIDTNVQLGNYELREISTYRVALRASRTGKGVPLLQDIPGLGVLFRPLPSAESSLQQNVIMGQSTIFPTLFDLMGLRWAPAIADLDPLALINSEFIVRQRKQFLTNRVFDFSSAKVDEALRIPDGERRGDLYRTQQTIPYKHPNGYQGPGMGLRDSEMKERYDPRDYFTPTPFAPSTSSDGHLNPYSDVERKRMENEKRRQEEMFKFEMHKQQIEFEKLKRENEELNKALKQLGPPMPQPLDDILRKLKGQPSPGVPMPRPIPGGSSKPPLDQGPSLVPPLPTGGPQSMIAPNPSSVFTTVRLSSGELNAPDTGVARLALYPAAPAPRRTLWTTMFGNR